MSDRRSGPDIVALSSADCWSALESTDLGRISLVEGDGPVTFPVNYRVAEIGETRVIALRTRSGNSIDHPGRAACFEIDWVDADRQGGGSVLVRGVLRATTPSDSIDSHPMVSADRDQWLVVVPDTVTGRLVSTPGGWTFHPAGYV